jgi:hypothetical protein
MKPLRPGEGFDGIQQGIQVTNVQPGIEFQPAKRGTAGTQPRFSPNEKVQAGFNPISGRKELKAVAIGTGLAEQVKGIIKQVSFKGKMAGFSHAAFVDPAYLNDVLSHSCLL